MLPEDPRRSSRGDDERAFGGRSRSGAGSRGTVAAAAAASPPRERSEAGRRGEAGRHPEAHGGGRGLRPAVVERGLQAAAARLRALRRPLLPERRGKARRRQLPAAARAADLRGHGGAPLRVPDHAGLRRRHDRAAGRLARRELLAEGPGPRRQVQVPGRPRAAAVGHGDHLRRAGLPDGARPQPRRGRDAPRRARGRRPRLRRRPSSTGPPTGAASTSTSPTARTWRAASSSRPSSGASRPSRTWASGSPAPPASRRAPCRPIAPAAR